MELILATVLVSAVIAPALGRLGSQVSTAKWDRDRVYAVQLADDVLSMLTSRGYAWMHGSAWVGPGAPAGLGDPFTAPSFTALRSDSIVGFQGWSAMPQWGSPSAVNPVLGGPQISDPLFSGQGNMGLGLNVDGAFPPQGNRLTFQQAYQFNRRVEIFGGDGYTPPGSPGMFAAPADCYFVRVTVSTQDNASGVGTFLAPEKVYQVVTIIGK